MSEGGLLPWKAQKINYNRGPLGNYSNIRCPLPDPPRGMKWIQNESTREWSVVPSSQVSEVVAVPIATTEEDATGTTTTTTAVVQAQEIIPATTATVTTTTDMDVIQAKAVAIAEASDKEEEEEKKTSADSKTTNLDDIVYIEHEVKPTDTFQGICLKYSVTPTTLRQTNNFSGRNLCLAPEVLLIPVTFELLLKRGIAVPDRSSEQMKIATFMEYFPAGCVSRKEAKAYLDMNDGDVEAAVQNMREDMEWDRKHGKSIAASQVNEANNKETTSTATTIIDFIKLPTPRSWKFMKDNS